MKPTTWMFLALSTSVLGLCAPAAVADEDKLFERIEQAAKEGRKTQALGLLELEMEGRAEKDRPAFGRLQGQYWNLIRQDGDFPRAFLFFERLADGHPNDPDALAAAANAIGGYIGWMKLQAAERASAIPLLGRRAHELYSRALRMEPENFAALLGLAIYEGFSPGGAARSAEAFAHLRRIKPAHPDYPWGLVDDWEQWLKGPRQSSPPTN